MNVKYRILRQPIFERIYLQQAYTTRNDRRNFFRQKENNTRWKIGSLSKEMKSTSTGKYVGKVNIFLIVIFYFTTDIKTKIITFCSWIFNMYKLKVGQQ